MFDIHQARIAIIGLGYVGLPLAVEFGKKYPTLGFDINAARIDSLTTGVDTTLEVSPEELAEPEHLTFSHQLDDLSTCNVYIVTVPTPIDKHKRPDLTPLRSASKSTRPKHASMPRSPRRLPRRKLPTANPSPL